MGNSTTLLDLLSSGQTQKEIVANSLFDAASPSTLFGRRASTTSALTWGYYGGTLGVNGVLTSIANGTVALTASATNYVESTTAGVVSVNTSGFTAGRIALYVVVTGASSVTSYTDNRAYGFSAASGGGSGTVTGVSVVSANGLAGTVATAATTPAITLTTSITGVLKGNGTAISAASSSTDYQVPITLTTTGTAGAATFTSNTLNIPNYATSGSALQTTGGTMTGNIALAAGTTSLAPLTFVTGANLTSAVGGSIEYDGTCFFASIGSATRTGVRSDQLAFLNTAYPLVSQIAAQKAFNATTNGQVSLVAGTHEFECLLNLSGMSATSGSFGFAFAGGATFTQQWHAMAIKAAALATAATWQQSFNTAANTTLATASTATVGFAFIRGRLNVTVSGTVIPQISLTVAAAANVGAGSYFKVGALGSGSGTTNIVVGTWS